MSETPFDVRLLEYANTPVQRERLEAWAEHGSQAAAAAALGCDPRAIRKARSGAEKNAARQGYAPGHFKDGVAPGYMMGKVTIQRGPDGQVERAWERQHPSHDNLERFREVIEGICHGIEGIAEPAPEPERVESNLITVIPMGDPHGGMRSWEAETGENFDLDEFKRRLRGGVARIVAASPNTEQCLMINLGDMFHADDGTNRTPASGHALDVDGRYAKVALIIFESMVYAIDLLRRKHKRVIVWNKPGNHDPHAWLMLAMALSAYFKDDPRVEVPIDPCMFSYLRFGKNLFGSTHGHGPKMAELPLIMANDRKEDWGQTTYRTWFVGHFHHRQVIKDFTGCTVEIARTLAGSDAWHHGKGYRSYKDLQAIVYDAEHGEVERHTCSLGMIG